MKRPLLGIQLVADIKRGTFEQIILFSFHSSNSGVSSQFCLHFIDKLRLGEIKGLLNATRQKLVPFKLLGPESKNPGKRNKYMLKICYLVVTAVIVNIHLFFFLKKKLWCM